MFKKNISSRGRILRFALGIILLAFAIWQNSWIAGLLALFTFFEALMSWCVVNQLLGINQCSINKK